MTFALKEFKELKKHLEDTIKIVLKKHGIESIEEHTDSRRRNALLFLNGVMNVLEDRIEKSGAKDLQPYVEIYYAAMFVVKQHYNTTLGWVESKEGSLSNKSLDKIMELTPTNFPSNYQLASFHRSLNNFLKLIFRGEDSRNGLQFPNPLSKIPAQQLAMFSAISYKLEEESQVRIYESYLGDGISEADFNSYVPPTELPKSAVIKLGSFQSLCDALEDLEFDQRADKNVAAVNEVNNKNRVRQLSFLLKLRSILAKSDMASLGDAEKLDREKVGILAGLMLIIREEIGVTEYSKKPFSETPILSSVIHTGLSKILNHNELCREDAEALITSAMNFLTYATIERTPNELGIKESPRIKHAFSDIPEFNLTTLLAFTQKLIRSCRVDAVNRCVEIHTKELAASLPNNKSMFGGYLNIFGGSGKESADEGKEKEKVIESPALI